MRPLFSDAPVMQTAQVMPAQMPHSQLASALMGGVRPLNLQPVNFGSGAMPLASMLRPQDSGSNVTSQTANLVWNPNNPVGTDSLNPNTANRGDPASNAWATYGGGFSGMPSSGAAAQTADVGSSPSYAPLPGDQSTIDALRQYGALAPQYQGAAPVQGSSPGMFGMLQGLFGGGGGSAPTGAVGGGAPL
jgi:hypothetical protein